MEIIVEVEGNLSVRINPECEEGHVIKLLHPTNNVFIPRYAKYKFKKYKIFFIEPYAFSNQQIESIEFPKNSSMLTFSSYCFQGTRLQKLQIPCDLSSLQDNWCADVYDLNDIDVSKKNIYFTYYENRYLIGKDSFLSKVQNKLHYARFDILDAPIPPFITILKHYSFGNHPQLRSITFSEDSELTTIQSFVIYNSPIQCLILPPKLSMIYKENFIKTPFLFDIRVSCHNGIYQVLDDRCLYRKSEKNSMNFDNFQLAPRDIERIEIQSFVTSISSYAFYQCNRLKEISFDCDSNLEVIYDFAFAFSSMQNNVVFPESLKDLRTGCLSDVLNVESFEFRANSISIANFSFKNCRNLSCIAFPNATEIVCSSQAFDDIPSNTKILVRKNASLKGGGSRKITFIEE